MVLGLLLSEHPLETKSVPGPGDGEGKAPAGSRGEDMALKLDGDECANPCCVTWIQLFSLCGSVFSVKWK